MPYHKAGHRGRGRGGGQSAKPKKGYLPEETMSSFRRISDELKQLDLNNEEEKTLFLTATFGFISEDVVRVSQNQTVSTIIESFINLGSPANLRTLFVASVADLSVAFLDRFASHVFESLIQRLPSFYQKIGESEDDDDDDVSQEEAETSLESVFEFVDSNFDTLVTHIYGSHVLRAILEGLSGVPVAHLVKKTQLTAKHGTFFKGESKPLQRVTVPQQFRARFEKYTNQLFRVCDYEVHLNDALFSVLLQAVLLILQQVDDEQCQSRCTQILQKVAESCPESEEDASKFLPHIATDSTGSHLLELIMRVSSSQSLKYVYDALLSKKLVFFAVHPCANHVLKGFISAIKDKELFESVFDEVEKHLEDVLAVGFLQLIGELAKACRRLGVRQEQFVNSLMGAFHCREPATRQRFMFKLIAMFLTYEVLFELEEGATSPKEGAEPPALKSPINVGGSLLLQELLQFQKPKYVALSLLDLSPQEVMTLCCDPAGSRVMDAFYTSPTVLDKNKDKVLAKLKGLLVEVACTRNGSRCLESMWKNLTVNQRTTVAKELSSSERLRGDHYGHFLYYNFGLAAFGRQRQHWLQQQGVETKRKRALKQLLVETESPAKKRKKEGKQAQKSEDENSEEDGQGDEEEADGITAMFMKQKKEKDKLHSPSFTQSSPTKSDQANQDSKTVSQKEKTFSQKEKKEKKKKEKKRERAPTQNMESDSEATEDVPHERTKMKGKNKQKTESRVLREEEPGMEEETEEDASLVSSPKRKKSKKKTLKEKLTLSNDSSDHEADGAKKEKRRKKKET